MSFPLILILGTDYTAFTKTRLPIPVESRVLII